MRRLNPADPDYRIRLLLRQDRAAATRLDRAETGTRSPDPVTPGTYERVYLDPNDPDIVVIEQDPDDGSDIVTLNTSTLMVPDLADPDIVTFPTL